MIEFFTIGRHLFNCTTIDYINILYTWSFLSCTCTVHGRVTTTNNSNVFTHFQSFRIFVPILQELDCAINFRRIAFQWKCARFPGTNCQIDIFETFCFQVSHIDFTICVHFKFNTHTFDEFDIVIDSPTRHTEARDSMNNSTTNLICVIKYSYIEARTSQEVRGSETSRSSTDDGNFDTNRSYIQFHFFHIIVVAFISCNAFKFTNKNRLFVIITNALKHTFMITNITCNMWKWVLGKDKLKSFQITLFSNKTSVFRNILINWTGFYTWSYKAIQHSKFFINKH